MTESRQISMTAESITARLKKVAAMTRFCRALRARPGGAVESLPSAVRGVKQKDPLSSQRVAED